jgi:hypothetical protein
MNLITRIGALAIIAMIGAVTVSQIAHAERCDYSSGDYRCRK